MKSVTHRIANSSNELTEVSFFAVIGSRRDIIRISKFDEGTGELDQLFIGSFDVIDSLDLVRILLFA